MKLYSKATLDHDTLIVFLYPFNSQEGVFCIESPLKKYIFNPLDLNKQSVDMQQLILRNRVLHEIPDHEFKSLIQRVNSYSVTDWEQHATRLEEDLPTIIEIVNNYRVSASQRDFH